MRSHLTDEVSKHKKSSYPRCSAFRSLRSRLTVLVLLATLPAFGLTLYTYFEQRQVKTAEVRQNALRLTQLASHTQAQLVEADRILTRNLIGLGVVTGLALIAAWLGSELYVLRQVRILVRATQQLATGDLSTRAGLPHTGGEFSQLACAFDAMAASLQHSLRQWKWAEATLRAREKQYRSIVDSLQEVLFQTDTTGLWTFLNPAWTKMTGFEVEESISTSFLDYIHPEERQDNLEKFQQLLAGQKNFYRNEVRYLGKKGNYRWVEVHTQIILAADSKIIGTAGTLNDITERKQAQEQLKREQEDLAAISTMTANAISTLNLEELLNVLLQRIVEVTKADAAVILLKENNHLRIRASIGLDEKLLSYFAVPIGQGFAGKIAANMEPLYLEDAQSNPLISSPAIKQWGIRTMLGVPLKRQNHLVGVLHVDWRSIHPQSERELHLLEITAERCAMAILNAQLYEALSTREARYRSLVVASSQIVWRTNAVGKVDSAIPAWSDYTGQSEEDIQGWGWMEALHPDDRELTLQTWEVALATNSAYETEYRLRAKDGSYGHFFVRGVPVLVEDGKVQEWVGTCTDITERKQTEEQLRQRMFYDSLTGLPNRALFLDRLGQLIQVAKEDKNRLFAVLFLDLDRFQIIKYSLGHLVADELLVATARKLQACQHKSDTVARVGADEFAILLEDIQEVPSDATAVAERISQELSLPIDLDGREVFPTASIGIVIGAGVPQPYCVVYDRPEDFLRAADTARNHLEQLGKTCYTVFNPSMHSGAMERLQLETDLRRAIEGQQFQVYYQAIVSLNTGKIAGFEALVRWLHPTRGLMHPGQFVPLAEETGLISLIDRWVLREACQQLAAWQQAFPFEVPLTMSVNLSGVQLVQLSLIERLDQILRETGVERWSLKLEITESVIMKNTISAVTVLGQLKALGVQLLIDDFGTGYSSFERLYQLPIDTLKVDRSFVSRISFDENSWEITRTIVALAANLGMEVIAEGVETAQQLDRLRMLQGTCQYGQGYLFSQPVDNKTAEKLLSAALQW